MNPAQRIATMRRWFRCLGHTPLLTAGATIVATLDSGAQAQASAQAYAEDRPKRLYANLGFTPVAISRRWVKQLPASSTEAAD